MSLRMVRVLTCRILEASPGEMSLSIRIVAI